MMVLSCFNANSLTCLRRFDLLAPFAAGSFSTRLVDTNDGSFNLDCPDIPRTWNGHLSGLDSAHDHSAPVSHASLRMLPGFENWTSIPTVIDPISILCFLVDSDREHGTVAVSITIWSFTYCSTSVGAAITWQTTSPADTIRIVPSAWLHPIHTPHVFPGSIAMKTSIRDTVFVRSNVNRT